MKVALISPRGAMRNQQNSILNTIYSRLRDIMSFIEVDDIEFMPNLGLLVIAAYLDPDDEVHYLEEDYVDPERSQEIVFDRSYDLVCLSGCNNQAKRAYQIADRFREMGVTVVMGGLHASSLPEEALEHVDSVMIGEGEDTFPAFLKDFKNGSFKKQYISSGNTDLTKVPMPRFDIVEDITRFNKITVQATRGCPRNCSYCSTKEVYGKRFRTKTPEQVAREIEMIKKLYPNPFISFADENLLADPKYARELVSMMIDQKVRWECYCDVAVYKDTELLDMLRESNCVELLIGFETVIPESLKKVSPWKAAMLDKYREAVETIQGHGVPLMGLFMVGFDSDGPDVFERIYEFIEETNMFDVDFAILCPIPGTQLYDELKKEGRITSEDWDRYTWYHVNYKPMKISPKELRDGIMWIFNKFNTPERIRKRKEFFNSVLRKLYGDEKVIRDKLEMMDLAQVM
ncbi:MAG: B12-binding domain-containing radical SAM protein [Candidatus Eremiobacteraeota bacterium]|nr:B12-binding domain-containing radical SAM protein [Candidatus Eremiobacteraeota bacterium]